MTYIVCVVWCVHVVHMASSGESRMNSDHDQIAPKKHLLIEALVVHCTQQLINCELYSGLSLVNMGLP